MSQVEIVILARDQATAALNSVRSALGGVGSMARGTALAGLAGATAGIAAMGAAALKAGWDGLQLNSSMEQVSAQLFAFTKDAGETERILADIRAEASKTPFAFQEMARATASLLPASKTSGVALMDLVKQAEILAALNPAEGLEGASFALKEALGGDFLSIIERFNLPKQRLNELKAQGVPAMEAISIAMQEMGADSSLVTGMAETMSGRWSTLMDTFDTVKASLSQPIFDLLKDGLMRLQPALDANMPRLQGMATALGERVAGALQWVAQTVMPMAVRGFGLIRDAVTTFQQAVSGDWVDSGIIHPFHRVVGVIGQVVAAFGEGGLAGAFAVLQPYAESAFKNLVAWVQGQLPGWRVQLAEWGRAAWQWIVDASPTVLAVLASVMTLIPRWLIDNRQMILGALAAWGAAAWRWLEDATPPMLAKLREWGGKLLGWLGENLPGWIAKLLEWGTAAAKWIADAAPPMLREAATFLGRLLSWAGSTVLPALQEKANEWGLALHDWIRTVLIPQIGPKLREFLVAAQNALNEIKGELAAIAVEIGNDILEGILSALRSGASAIANLIKGMVNDALGALGGMLGGGSGGTPTNAAGSANFGGGPTWVGENGREMVWLPRGSRIVGNAQSEMMGGGGGQIVNHYHIYNQQDWEMAAREQLYAQRRRQRVAV